MTANTTTITNTTTSTTTWFKQTDQLFSTEQVTIIDSRKKTVYMSKGQFSTDHHSTSQEKVVKKSTFSELFE